MLFKFNISALILKFYFQGAGIQNQLLYHAEWSEKRKSTFFHNFQKTMILRESQKSFCEIYLGGKKTISTDMFFILENITTNCQMDASEFEEMLYTMLSEEPFANYRLDMTDGNEEYTISDYASQNFAITIGDTWTCITCETQRSHKISKDLSLILSLEQKSKYGKTFETNQSREKDPFREELYDNERFDGIFL